MKRLTRLFFAMLMIGFVSCQNGTEEFNKWIAQNKGKKFTPEHMQELISKFGSPTDSSSGGDVDVRGFENAFFLGPFYDSEEGKQLYATANAEWDALYAYWDEYMKSTGEEQGLPESLRFSDRNYNWSDYTAARDAYYEKYEKIYRERSKDATFTLGEFFAAYQKKYPSLSKQQCVDSIKAFNFVGVGDYDLKNIFNKNYSFLVEKSVSYKKTFGKEKEDMQDFKIDLTSDVVILGDGTISDDTHAGGYCITEDSKNSLKNKIVGEWVYKSGGSVIGSFTFNADGTYRMSNTMFGGMSKEGKWKITCAGEIDATNQNTNLTITDDGISVGETTYRRN